MTPQPDLFGGEVTPEDPDACGGCHSTETKVVATPSTSNYAKIVCARCGQWRKWIPWPRATVRPGETAQWRGERVEVLQLTPKWVQFQQMRHGKPKGEPKWRPAHEVVGLKTDLGRENV